MRQPMNQEVREKEVRILTIIGQAGVGKSNVVFASARYICERRRFVHGVHTFHVDKKISSHGTGSSIRYETLRIELVIKITVKRNVVLGQFICWIKC